MQTYILCKKNWTPPIILQVLLIFKCAAFFANLLCKWTHWGQQINHKLPNPKRFYGPFSFFPVCFIHLLPGQLLPKQGCRGCWSPSQDERYRNTRHQSVTELHDMYVQYAKKWRSSSCACAEMCSQISKTCDLIEVPKLLHTTFISFYHPFQYIPTSLVH